MPKNQNSSIVEHASQSLRQRMARKRAMDALGAIKPTSNALYDSAENVLRDIRQEQGNHLIGFPLPD